MTQPTHGFGEVVPRTPSASPIARCIASLSSTHAPFVARFSGGHGARRGAHTPSLPSGLSPSAPEFHRISQPRGEGSRALTAGRDLHPAPRGDVLSFGCCPAKCKRPLWSRQTPIVRTPTGRRASLYRCEVP